MRILLFTSINFSLGLRITSLQEYFHQHNAIPVKNYSQGIRNSLKQCLRQDHAIPLNEKVYVNTETIVNFVCFNREMKKKPWLPQWGSNLRCDAQNVLVECSSTQEIEKLSCTLALGNDAEFEKLLPKNRLHRPWIRNWPHQHK